MQRVRDLQTFHPKWNAASKYLLEGLRELCRRGAGKGVRGNEDDEHKKTKASYVQQDQYTYELTKTGKMCMTCTGMNQMRSQH